MMPFSSDNIIFCHWLAIPFANILTELSDNSWNNASVGEYKNLFRAPFDFLQSEPFFSIEWNFTWNAKKIEKNEKMKRSGRYVAVACQWTGYQPKIAHVLKIGYIWKFFVALVFFRQPFLGSSCNRSWTLTSADLTFNEIHKNNWRKKRQQQHKTAITTVCLNGFAQFSLFFAHFLLCVFPFLISLISVFGLLSALNPHWECPRWNVDKPFSLSSIECGRGACESCA